MRKRARTSMKTTLSPRRTKQPPNKSRLSSLLPLLVVSKKLSLATRAIPPRNYREAGALSATETESIKETPAELSVLLDHMFFIEFTLTSCSDLTCSFAAPDGKSSCHSSSSMQIVLTLRSHSSILNLSDPYRNVPEKGNIKPPSKQNRAKNVYRLSRRRDDSPVSLHQSPPLKKAKMLLEPFPSPAEQDMEYSSFF
jgi:hypothetical protein